MFVTMAHRFADCFS